MGKWWFCGVSLAVIVASVSVIVGVGAKESEPPAASQTVVTATAAAYGTLGIYEGRLALFCGGETPDEVYDVWVSALPDAERERLAAGIPVADRTAFFRLLQEYTG